MRNSITSAGAMRSEIDVNDARSVKRLVILRSSPPSVASDGFFAMRSTTALGT